MKISLKRLMLAFMLMSVVTSCAPAQSPMGLVLSGGGAKGAYEIGVWKAFCVAGIDRRIEVFSGTSVGAINAMMFATVGEPNKCATLWRESVGKIFSCNTKMVQGEFQKTADDIESALTDVKRGKRPGESLSTAETISVAAMVGLSAIFRATDKANIAMHGPSNSVGLCDSGRLRAVLMRNLPEHWRPDPPLVYVTALAKDSGIAHSFLLNGNKKARVIDYLMASTAIPGVFNSVEIDNVVYVDGGYEHRGGDNIPIKPICGHPDVKDVFVVYLDSASRAKRRLSPSEFPNVNLIEIFPSQNIGGAFGGWAGVFDMSDVTSTDLMKLGYDDAMRVLRRHGLVAIK